MKNNCWKLRSSPKGGSSSPAEEATYISRKHLIFGGSKEVLKEMPNFGLFQEGCCVAEMPQAA